MPKSPKKPLKLGVLGGPAVGDYSLSPHMHQRALAAAGLKGSYAAIGKAPEEIDTWLADEALSFDGFNVTMPHKQRVWRWIKDEAGGTFGEAAVEGIGAVNTVAVRDGKPVGYNTDGAGFLAPLTHGWGVKLSGWRAVLLGAGGAAQAIAHALEGEGVQRLVIWDVPSSPHQPDQLAGKVNRCRGSEFAEVASELRMLPLEESQLLVNATPLGMVPDKPDSPTELCERLHPDLAVYDIVYQPRETALIRTARDKGCRTITGEQMLAAQGAVGFSHWTGKTEVHGTPISEIMREALIEHLTGHR